MIKVELHAVAIDGVWDASTFGNMVELVEKNILDLCEKSEVQNFEVIFILDFVRKINYIEEFGLNYCLNYKAK